MNKDKARIRNWRFQDKPCIWWAGGAAFSLPHYVNRFQRSTSSEHSLIILPSRAIFSLILGSDEDRLKAPEGLYHWRIRQSNPYQRLAKPIFQSFESFSSTPSFWTTRQARHREGCFWARHCSTFIPVSADGWGTLLIWELYALPSSVVCFLDFIFFNLGGEIGILQWGWP